MGVVQLEAPPVLRGAVVVLELPPLAMEPRAAALVAEYLQRMWRRMVERVAY